MNTDVWVQKAGAGRLGKVDELFGCRDRERIGTVGNCNKAKDVYLLSKPPSPSYSSSVIQSHTFHTCIHTCMRLQASQEPPGPLRGLAQGQGWGAGAAQGERCRVTAQEQGLDEGLAGAQTPTWGTWSFRKVWTLGMWRRRGCWRLPCLAFSTKDPCLTSAAGVGQGRKVCRWYKECDAVLGGTARAHMWVPVFLKTPTLLLPCLSPAPSIAP